MNACEATAVVTCYSLRETKHKQFAHLTLDCLHFAPLYDSQVRCLAAVN